MVDAHRRTLDQLATGVAIFGADRTLTFYNTAYRSLWDLDPGFLDQGPTDSAVLDRLRAARKLPGRAGFPAMEEPAARGLSRARSARIPLAPARRPHLARRHHAKSRRRRHLSVRRRHRTARSRAALRRADPRAGRDARQSLRSGRGVRKRRAAAPAQSRLLAACGSSRRKCSPNVRISRRSSPGARRCIRRTRPCGALRTAVTGIGQREPVNGRLERRDGSVIDLHDAAAAGWRHARHLPGRHRQRECRARLARAQRGAGRRRPDQGRLPASRLLRIALAAHQHHRLCAFPRRLRRPARSTPNKRNISATSPSRPTRCSPSSTTSSISPRSMPAR